MSKNQTMDHVCDGWIIPRSACQKLEQTNLCWALVLSFLSLCGQKASKLCVCCLRGGFLSILPHVHGWCLENADMELTIMPLPIKLAKGGEQSKFRGGRIFVCGRWRICSWSCSSPFPHGGSWHCGILILVYITYITHHMTFSFSSEIILCKQFMMI